MAHEGLYPHSTLQSLAKRASDGFTMRSKSIKYDVFWTNVNTFLTDRLLNLQVGKNNGDEKYFAEWCRYLSACRS